MPILSIIFLAFCAFCLFKESKITGTFKAFGVYGRFTAYLALFAPLGLGAFIASFFAAEPDSQRWIYPIVALFGILIYVIAFLKCPSFLKGKLIPCMFISGIGVCLKICLFFIGAVWKLTGPQEMQDAEGNTVYVYNGEVYTPGGKHVGTANAERTAYTVKE